MEIHGNVFTVSTVWGTEYQSSVSIGVCPLRLHYLLDGNTVPMPRRWTECQHYKGTEVKLHCWRSACKRKRSSSFASAPFEHLEAIFIIIILNSALKDKLFWMGLCSQGEWNTRLLCAPTSAIEDVEVRGVLVMQLSPQTGVYWRNASLLVNAGYRGIQSLTPGWHICIFLLSIFGINIITTVNFMD